MSKESENAQFFKSVQIYLINCQLSAKFKRVSVVHHKKDQIKRAANLEKLFEILHPYWNWVNYDLLESLVEIFGNEMLKQQLKDYLSELDTFEGDTSVADFEEAVMTNVAHYVEEYYLEIEIKLKKDPRQFTMRDVRNLKQNIEGRAALKKSVVIFKSVKCKSVRIILLYPQLALELLPSAMDQEFQASHDIVSITITSWDGLRSRSLEDIDVQVSVSVSTDT